MRRCPTAEYAVLFYVACIVLLTIAPLVGLLEPEPPFDDVYFGYFFVSGPAVWFVGVWCGELAGPALLHVFNSRTASVLSIVILPGVVNLILGGLQWYGVMRLFRWIMARRNRAVPGR